MSGAARTRIRPRRFPEIDTGIDDLRLTWYRACTTPPARRWSDAGDAAYAEAEYCALLVSWLGQPSTRSANRVDGASPWGPSWPPSRWRQVALGCGLVVADRPAASSGRVVPAARVPVTQLGRPVLSPGRTRPEAGGRSVLIVGSDVIGAAGSRETAGCRRLAAAAGCAVLEVAFDESDRAELGLPLAGIDSAEKIDAISRYLVEVAR